MFSNMVALSYDKYSRSDDAYSLDFFGNGKICFLIIALNLSHSDLKAWRNWST